MARSVKRDATGHLRGSTKDENRAAVVEQAAKAGISERTVERALAKDKSKRPRKVRPEPPPYQPDAQEQANLDNLEKGLSKLSAFIERTGVVKILIKLDSQEHHRWAELLAPVCKVCKYVGAKP